MLTDIMIPLNLGSRNDDLELKYCLRSVEKHLSGVGNIYIVGECPDFINKNTVVHIPFKESPDNKQRAFNIYSKIMAAIYDRLIYHKLDSNDNTSLSNNFLFMNDDHFLLSDYEAGNFPYYHRGPINLNQPNEAQLAQMRNTVELFKASGCNSVYDFSVHSPIVYNKNKLFIAKDIVWPEYGYEIKSLYANQTIDTTNWVPCEDFKFKEPMVRDEIYAALEGHGWFSCSDKALKSGDLKNVLQELYPLPSKYEL